ncbi:hypothetical protein [Candidatus Enterococcus murrayae]|uniref:Uncharacterized protein n=1 Tax=Candidatus Enterococcus murrayae TaxID=2815321 RepID=A0ABS3HEK8_9ENTE|nr:hypothetical protein [Enterococcus sp. MJM16]MBO0451882.1 hypothetical protein [Enterococcus sp. MJM16]
MIKRIREIGAEYPILAHIIGYFLLAIGLGAFDLYVNDKIGFAVFMGPLVLFLFWLLESYYRLSYKKIWLIYFVVLFIFLTIFDRGAWVDWTSSVVQLGTAAIVATLAVVFSRREGRS